MLYRDPNLLWLPLPEATTQPLIKPTQWIIHTAVDAPGPTNLHGYFERYDINLESHTWLRWDRHEQFIPFNRSADANYKANRWWDGTGAVSTETEDDGDPEGKPWNQYQLRELVRFGKWLRDNLGIPAVLPPTPSAPGMGYHVLYPQDWTNVRGKTCPGATRIHQFKTIVLPSIARASTPTPLPQEDDDVRSYIIFFTNGGSGNHAYHVFGNTGKYLPTAGAISALEFLGVARANQPSSRWDATLASAYALLDGPLKNV